MPLPYTGNRGELNFEEDFVALLQKAGWGEVLQHAERESPLLQGWDESAQTLLI